MHSSTAASEFPALTLHIISQLMPQHQSGFVFQDKKVLKQDQNSTKYIVKQSNQSTSLPMAEKIEELYDL